MTPTCHPSWTNKGLRAVLRDTLPQQDHAAALADAPTAVPMLDDADARQARISRMGQRLKHLVQVADASTGSAVPA